ncbi:hypothetical protein HPB49_001117 [Dermacentor silvarum]|uniref:Uncharacterized protein n=1 Tax=Dermacentor silvarum TaxID=543639 RepID=A0ACB8CNW9_DERSI|nr:hypothetical protein HPB49_001117 [Dermacentor silvarum]
MNLRRIGRTSNSFSDRCVRQSLLRATIVATAAATAHSVSATPPNPNGELTARRTPSERGEQRRPRQPPQPMVTRRSSSRHTTAANREPPTALAQIRSHPEEILINFMERHPRLVSKSGELDGDFTVAKRNDLWGELAALLNSEGPPTKTESQWKVWWSKYLYKVRREAAVVAGEMRATDGGRLGGNKGRVLALVGRGSGGGLGPAYFMSDDSEESHSESSGQAIAATSEPGTSGTGGASRPAESPAPRAVPAAEPRVQARPRRGPATSRRQPPRQRSEEELLEQVVLDGGRFVNVLQSQVTIQRDILAQVTRLGSAGIKRNAVKTEVLNGLAYNKAGRHPPETLPPASGACFNT